MIMIEVTQWAPEFSGTPVPQVGREVGRVYGNEVNWLWPSGRRADP